MFNPLASVTGSGMSMGPKFIQLEQISGYTGRNPETQVLSLALDRVTVQVWNRTSHFVTMQKSAWDGTGHKVKYRKITEKWSKISCILFIRDSVAGTTGCLQKYPFFPLLFLVKETWFFFIYYYYYFAQQYAHEKNYISQPPCAGSKHVTNSGQWYIGRSSQVGLLLKLLSKGSPSNQHCTKVLARATRQES